MPSLRRWRARCARQASDASFYAVLATAVETGSNVTFIVAAQVLRILVMLFAAPSMARGLAALSRRRQSRAITEPSRP